MTYYLNIKNDMFYFYRAGQHNQSFDFELICECTLSDLDHSANIKTIQDLLKSKRISQCKALINKQSVLTRYLVIPATSEAEVNQMLRFEAIKHLPYGYDDYYHYHLTFNFDLAGAKLHYVAIEKALVDQYIKVAQTLKIELTDLGLDVIEIANFHKAQLIEESEEDLYVFTQPMGNSLYLISYYKQTLVSFRKISSFFPSELDNPRNQFRLNSELRLNYEYLKREHQIHADKLHLCGPESILSFITQEMHDQTEKNSTPELDFTFDTETPEAIFEYYFQAQSIKKQWSLSLLPKQYIDELKQQHTIKKTVIFAVSLLLMIGSFIFAFLNIQQSKAEVTSQNKRLYKRYSPLSAELSIKKTRIESLRQYVKSDLPLLEILDKVSAIPMLTSKSNQKISISQAIYVKGSSLRLTGMAFHIPQVHDFRKELKKLDLFADVKMKIKDSQKKQHGKIVVTYEIECLLSKTE